MELAHMKTDTLKISSPMIIDSPSGYYIGTTYYDSAHQDWLPYSQGTVFFSSYSDAATQLIMDNFMSALDPDFAKGIAPSPDLPY
jgi:hypothetical protein